MPMYDYRCTACGARFEAWQKFSDEPIRVCPDCSGPAQRVIHAPGIMFKGSGFYTTDNKGTGAAPAPVGESPAASGASATASEAAKPAHESAPGAASTASPAAASKPAAAPPAS